MAPVPGAMGEHVGSTSVNERSLIVTLRFWQPMNGMQKNWKLNVELARLIRGALNCGDANGGESGRKTAVAVAVVAMVLVSSSVLLPSEGWTVIVTLMEAVEPPGVIMSETTAV